MIELNEKEMLDIDGGSIGWGTIALIAAGITFIIGIIDGYINPQKCNN